MIEYGELGIFAQSDNLREFWKESRTNGGYKIMEWMVGTYQGIGAAWAWIILNFGYFIFEVPVMHRRLLKDEMGKWYRRDIILPILIVTVIGLLTRAIMPVDASKLVTLLGMLITLALTFAVSVLAANHLNIRMLNVNRL